MGGRDAESVGNQGFGDLSGPPQMMSHACEHGAVEFEVGLGLGREIRRRQRGGDRKWLAGVEIRVYFPQVALLAVPRVCAGHNHRFFLAALALSD